MFCHYCGNQLPEGASFCTKCGNAVVAQAAPVPGVVSPAATFTPPVVPASTIAAKHTATIGKRVWNLILDSVFQYIFSVVLTGAVVVVLIPHASFPLTFVVAEVTFLIYFILFESIWQRTPAKWITKTKVVKLDGSKPGLGSIVGRTFARFIPFEVFSFYGDFPFGWHDHLSGTMVVPAAYSAEDIKAVQPHERGKGRLGLIILIVGGLLFAIAIFGIIASIVLVSLNSARSKGADALVTVDIQEVAKDAVVYDINHNTYVGACTDSTISSTLADASSAGTAGKDTTQFVCNESASSFAASVPLRSGGYLCGDSSGKSATLAAPLTTETTCPTDTSSSSADTSTQPTSY